MDAFDKICHDDRKAICELTAFYIKFITVFSIYNLTLFTKFCYSFPSIMAGFDVWSEGS